MALLHKTNSDAVQEKKRQRFKAQRFLPNNAINNKQKNSLNNKN